MSELISGTLISGKEALLALANGEQRELRFSLLEHLKSELLKRTDEEVEELLS